MMVQTTAIVFALFTTITIAQAFLTYGPTTSIAAEPTRNRIPLPTSCSSSSSLLLLRLRLAPQQLGFFEPLPQPKLELSDQQEHERIVQCESFGLNQHDGETSLLTYEQGLRRQEELWQAQAQRVALSSSNNNNNNNGGGSSSSSSSSFWKPQSAFHDNNQDTKTTATTTTTTTTTTVPGLDTILMLEHTPVYTLGTASKVEYILDHSSSSSSHNDNNNNNYNNHNIPVHRIRRGGEVTYHGPGQLTVYPILDLRNYRTDIHWYMRALEQVLLVALHSAPLNLYDATRDADTTGVWMQGHKVAAVGVHARRWITQHGLAINVEHESLAGFQHIVPCGIEGRPVGCVNQFLEQQGKPPITVADMAVLVKQAFEQVFAVKLVETIPPTTSSSSSPSLASNKQRSQ